MEQNIEQKTIEKKINGTNSWFFEEIDKTDNPLLKLIKGKKKNQVTNTTDKRGDITTFFTEIKSSIREYYE